MVLLLLAVIADHHQQRPPLFKASIRIPASVSAANTPGSLRAAMWRRSAGVSTSRLALISSRHPSLPAGSDVCPPVTWWM